jgi:hypothetical protein
MLVIEENDNVKEMEPFLYLDYLKVYYLIMDSYLLIQKINFLNKDY